MRRTTAAALTVLLVAAVVRVQPAFAAGAAEPATSAFAAGTASAAGTAAGQATLPRHSAVLTAAIRAADYYRGTTSHTTVLPTNGWSWSTYAEGLLALYQQTGEGRYLADELAVGRSHAWQVATAAAERNPNNLEAGQTYFRLSGLDPSVDLTPMDAVLARDLTGVAPAQYDWIDALFMGLPDWSMWSTRTRSVAYLAKMDSFYLWTRDAGGTSSRCAGKAVPQRGLFDAAYGLWYRDCRYIRATDSNGRPVFWSRGNGWVIAAMAKVLATLPTGDPRATKYSTMLQTMASHLLPLQGADGLWRSNLTDAAQYPEPETSGSALITYALAYGISTGLLDAATYLPAVQRAWQGLSTVALQPSGFVTGCQAEGISPARPYSAPAPRTAATATSAGTVNQDSPPFCVGAFLLAAGQIARLTGAYSTGRHISTTAQQVGNEATHVNDGNIATRWAASGMGQAVLIDLGANRLLSNAMVAPYQDRAYRYKIETSTDKVTWQRVVDRIRNTDPGTQLDDFSTGPVTARYVRLTVFSVYGANTPWVAINEFAVYDAYRLPTG